METPTCDFERHKAAAATVVQKPHQPGEAPEGWIATFAGPDDNCFQLVSPCSGRSNGGHGSLLGALLVSSAGSR